MAAILSAPRIPDGVTRREFLAISAGVPVAFATGCLSVPGEPPGQTVDSATLHATRRAPTDSITAGLHDLEPAGARAFLYVPPAYTPTTAAPLIVLLHGAGRDSMEWMQAPLLSLFDAQNAVILSPDSTGPTWDVILGGFGPDVRLIDTALNATYRYCNVDPARIALGGFSDGATYALSLGIPNGTMFSALMAFSPGFNASPGRRGTPRVFIAHGVQDPVLPIDATSRTIVPALRQQGYSVTYEEFAGVHAIYTSEVTNALNWFLGH